MNYKILCVVVVCIVCLAISFAIGYKIAADKYQLEISQIREDAQAQLNKAQEEKNTKENVYSTTLSNAQSAYAVSLDEISKEFSNLVNLDLGDVDVNPVDNGMHNSEDNASGNASVSTDSGTASGVQSCNCRCNGTDKSKLQRLYQEQLTIARDCDITASKYNSLIELYNGIEANQ